MTISHPVAKESVSRKKLLLALSTSALVFIPAVANAVVPAIPSSVRPDIASRQLKVVERPEVTGKSIITVPESGGKALKGNVNFVLKSISFEGADKLSQDEIKSLYQDKIGTKITLGELNKIVDNVTAYYRNQGYILTRAVLPPQRINSGVVKIRIVEGFVSDVQLRGDVGSAGGVLSSYAEKIKSSKPLNAKTLEHYLLLMEDLPGVEARAVLQPSPTAAGASQIIVNIKRKTLEGSSVSVDNRGTRFIGPVQATAILTGNNLLGLDDQTSLRVINTPFNPEELKYVGVRHEEQVGSQGTKVSFSADFSKTHPGFNLDPFDIEGTNSNVGVGVIHPLIRSRQTNWFVNSDFNVGRNTLSVFNSDPTLNFVQYQDNTRVLKVGSSYDFVDSTDAVNRLDGSASKGFNWDAGNGGLAHSRNNGNSSFWKFNANATRIQPIVGAWAAFASIDGQYAADALYSSEEYTLGGKNFGSAYDPAELTGDSGLAGRLELQYNGALETKYLATYQAYGFYDIGEVWNRNIIAASEAKTASLASAGLGARLNFNDSISGSAELSFPLTRKVAASGEDGDSPRFFFNLQYRY